MELKFSIQTKINKPVAEVFDAVINPKKIVGYFCNQSDGPLVEGKTVHWSWTAKPTPSDVKVKQIIQNEKIVIDWPTMDGLRTVAEMTFTALDNGGTMVKISESGWPDDAAGLKTSYKHCEGWQHMLCCMKAYLIYGIDLRK